jgi:hypothetical protein
LRNFALILILSACNLWSQANRGELRLIVTDPSGAALRSHVDLVSHSTGYHASLDTDITGRVSIESLPFGAYQVTIERLGFAPYRGQVEIHSVLPAEHRVKLAITEASTQLKVVADETLVDLHTTSSATQIGSRQIEERLSSLPGRSVQDLVVSQPGWLYEGNAVLHPRGAEYQTQFVVDGIPLTENRSPSFGPEIEADDLESLTIYTAGFPAEYGRKMGGVIELNTRRPIDPGLHGTVVLSGGSYNTASGYGQLQKTRRRDSLLVSASGSHSDHYLNPVVPQNYTNTGTTADFAARYEFDPTDNDRLIVNGRRESSRFLIPNELIQQQAGQRQDGRNAETLGAIRYQHILSADSLLSLAGMGREYTTGLNSNVNPTPIAAFQRNRFNDWYFKGTYALHSGPQELKAGVESDSKFLHENFNYDITDPSQFDNDIAQKLEFSDRRLDLEEAAFAEDVIHFKDWSASIGLRWDHYQLLVNKQALSPRISLARAFRSQNLVLHASYDRVFDTPSFENILLSSSTQVSAISDQFLRLPVQPSSGNYWEIGSSQGFGGKVRLDVNGYWRNARNAADDDQLLNTGVSYPITFERGAVYGVEGKLQVISAGPVSGFASYSYMVARQWFPVTGGLFLGDDAENLPLNRGHFSATQDQRNTVASRWQYKAGRGIMLSSGVRYGSGLPFEYGGTKQEALDQYGPMVVSRLNFERGRVLPQFAVSASASAELFGNEQVHVKLYVDGDNLNNRLNVLNFGGLFSGNAIAPQRSVHLRLDTRF